jgi:prepilin-type N-terminal cleavage/methylation domain-containing protein/prepilin-type processing-associated H-X9-DG protein
MFVASMRSAFEISFVWIVPSLINRKPIGAVSTKEKLKMHRRYLNPTAFTLIELLVVLAIVGLLMGLALPAVQSVRESSRRSHCENNLRQVGLALSNYESSFRALPLGSEFGTNHAWSSRILPYLEQGNLNSEIDFRLPWDDGMNRPAMSTTLPIFSCPSSGKRYAGSTDYCGIAGTYNQTGPVLSNGRNGVLFVAESASDRSVRLNDIRDGLSNTIAVGEAVRVTEINFGYWACGLHCVTHEDGGINDVNGGYNEIASLHPGGANVVLCDGSVKFLSASLLENLVSALCTRAGAELVGDY